LKKFNEVINCPRGPKDRVGVGGGPEKAKFATTFPRHDDHVSVSSSDLARRPSRAVAWASAANSPPKTARCRSCQWQTGRRRQVNDVGTIAGSGFRRGLSRAHEMEQAVLVGRERDMVVVGP